MDQLTLEDSYFGLFLIASNQDYRIHLWLKIERKTYGDIIRKEPK